MSTFKPIEITDNTVLELKRWLTNKAPVFPVGSDENSSLLICYSMSLEIGGPNDELARFIFDEDKKEKVDPKSFNVAKIKVRSEPEFKKKKMHVDGLQEIELVNGHLVQMVLDSSQSNETVLNSYRHRDL